MEFFQDLIWSVGYKLMDMSSTMSFWKLFWTITAYLAGIGTIIFAIIMGAARGGGAFFGSYYGKVFWGSVLFTRSDNNNLINATLNIIEADGIYVDTQVADMTVDQMFRNPFIAMRVRQASKYTTPDMPLITFPKLLKAGYVARALNRWENTKYKKCKSWDAYQEKKGRKLRFEHMLRPKLYQPPTLYVPVYNAIISEIDATYNHWAMLKEIGAPCLTVDVVVALTYEKFDGDDRTTNTREQHFRVMMISEKKLLALPARLPWEDDQHRPQRMKTLHQLAILYRHDLAHPEEPMRFGRMQLHLPLSEIPERFWPRQYRKRPAFPRSGPRAARGKAYR